MKYKISFKIDGYKNLRYAIITEILLTAMLSNPIYKIFEITQLVDDDG